MACLAPKIIEGGISVRKIAFIGAGSFGFTRCLVMDILSFPALADSEIALMDIDTERLAAIKRAVDKIIAAGNYPAKVIATTDRAEALKGADGVVCTILAGGVNVWRHDIEIPKKYGVDINVGDTRGPAGIFRALRTIPVMLDICRDIERYCPDAIFLNYTNPMAMLCRAMQSQSKVTVTGLCHSVQGTAAMLARWIGAPTDEITYLCAGINHQAFYLDYKWNGRDAYPLIRKAITENPDIYKEEIVRNEMFLHLDYYVTESSGHNSEYNAWFRKRPDLIEKYCIHGTGWNPGEYAYILKEYLAREHTWKKEIDDWLEQETVDLNRGGEYRIHIQRDHRRRHNVRVQRKRAELRANRQSARGVLCRSTRTGFKKRPGPDACRPHAGPSRSTAEYQCPLRRACGGGSLNWRPAQGIPRSLLRPAHIRGPEPCGNQADGG